jgi:DNA-directed RNA polymerase specialized sigma24 family protein
MSFTARDLRYEPEKSFPALYAYLRQRAQRYLRELQYDAEEVELVVNHVVERLVLLGVIGGGDRFPETALDRLDTVQFYAFLNRCIHNKAIDRLRRRRLEVVSFSSMAGGEEREGEGDAWPEMVEPLWGPPPFANPEEAALEAVTRQELRSLLKHCLKSLASAPRQLRAVLEELEKQGALELLAELRQELEAMQVTLPPATEPLVHGSQHRDHAYKKLRSCLQAHSSNLAVAVALRLTEYEGSGEERSVPVRELLRSGLTLAEVKRGLRQLAAEGLLQWDESAAELHLSPAQLRQLARYYKAE